MSKRNLEDARRSYITARDHDAFLMAWQARRTGEKTAHQLVAECVPLDIDAVHRKQVVK